MKSRDVHYKITFDTEWIHRALYGKPKGIPFIKWDLRKSIYREAIHGFRVLNVAIGDLYSRN